MSKVTSGRIRDASQVGEVMHIDRHYMQPLASEGSELFDAICYRRCGMEAGPRQLEAEKRRQSATVSVSFARDVYCLPPSGKKNRTRRMSTLSITAPIG